MKPMIYFFLTVLLIGCESDDPQTELEELPPATQTGENTFGCLVDGKAWVTETSVDATAYYQSGVLFITAFLTNTRFDQTISLDVHDNNLITGEYLLSDSPFALIEDLGNNCEYRTTSLYTGKLTITHFDQTNFVISGTFEFIAYSTDCTKTIDVTHGRFDLNYAP